MAFHVTQTWYNGYRCGCCRNDHESSSWAESLEEALADLPTEFPTENEFGGIISVVVRDGSTGAEVAYSKVTFAPVYQRGDGYKYTAWTLYIDEEAAPGRGTFVQQIIKGARHEGPLNLITDRSWSDLCAELAEARKQADIRKAEADRADAERRLNHLRGSGTP